MTLLNWFKSKSGKNNVSFQSQYRSAFYVSDSDINVWWYLSNWEAENSMDIFKLVDHKSVFSLRGKTIFPRNSRRFWELNILVH